MEQRRRHRAQPLGVDRRRGQTRFRRSRTWRARSRDAGRERLAQHAEAGDDDRAQVEPHGAVGDPLEVVRELLGHRRLVAAPHLREAGQPGPDDEPLPVRGQVVRELGEEPRPDRARPDERHVAAQDVPELRDLVELRRLQPAADARQLGVGRARTSSLAEVLADALLGAGPHRPELQHREEVAAAADALAAVEHRPAARHEHDDERDHERERQRDQAEERSRSRMSSVRSSTSMRRCGASVASRV